ncbi:hypothetical protein ATE92_0344 [Ulvibacter sp. MAR_2010_11]|uniref:hypothetical protein n=1 Tax=Ulvibacter sp. MAR_2010_11 TaxID=1250229 RepID=UPI000C2CDEBF|nr:hypothetical protein [Ulvibacter sp. MAR_2010_11]PKA82218.1 hypothetical protein ATE92_0344 [Ulvibacter sp. MAR_2010_11]
MKILVTICTALLVLLLSNSITAQTYNNGANRTFDPQNRAQAVQLSLLSSQVIAPNNNLSVSAANNIYILQVGNYNNIVSNTHSLKSDINLVQHGNSNEMLLNVTSKIIDEDVIQFGNNNKFIDLSSRATTFHSAAVLQKGTNQNLIWYGSNSISEKMVVTMQGKNQTIFVRNIKR